MTGSRYLASVIRSSLALLFRFTRLLTSNLPLVKDGAYRAGILQAGGPAQGGHQSPAEPRRGGLCLPLLAAQAAGGQEQAAAAAPWGGGGRAGQPQHRGHGAGQDEDARRHPAGQTLALRNCVVHIL